MGTDYPFPESQLPAIVGKFDHRDHPAGDIIFAILGSRPAEVPISLQERPVSSGMKTAARDIDIPPSMRSPDREGPYTIGEVAEMLGVSVPTLRLYEREGLILPQRRESGHRLYTERDIQRLHCIRRSITEDKVSIAGIRRLLSLIPCWVIKACSADSLSACPARRSHDAPCWTLAGRSAECTDVDCRSCSVYSSVEDCSNLKNLILSLTTHP
jgi:MerR family transcriptional regulator/heat shock protein HspR